MSSPAHPLPVAGTEERDKTHLIKWIEVKQDPGGMGTQIKVQIFKLRHGRPANKGTVLHVPGVRYDYFRATNQPISYFLPPSDAAVRKVKRRGELFAMPGMITD